MSATHSFPPKCLHTQDRILIRPTKMPGWPFSNKTETSPGEMPGWRWWKREKAEGGGKSPIVRWLAGRVVNPAEKTRKRVQRGQKGTEKKGKRREKFQTAQMGWFEVINKWHKLCQRNNRAVPAISCLSAPPQRGQVGGGVLQNDNNNDLKMLAYLKLTHTLARVADLTLYAEGLLHQRASAQTDAHPLHRRLRAFLQTSAWVSCDNMSPKEDTQINQRKIERHLFPFFSSFGFSGRFMLFWALFRS